MKFKQTAAGTVLLLGDADSDNSSILKQSGLELELLPSQGSVTWWRGQDFLFVHPPGSVIANSVERRRLFRTLLAQRSPPLRSVVLALDCETLLKPDAATATSAKAQDYQSILSDLARELPVYVLFTKAERIAYFQDFVSNLNEGDTSQMLGVTLSLAADDGQDNESDAQSQRLDHAFQTIYYWLADKRTACLRRAHGSAGLSNIYEFPREFAKLRPLVVQFLTGVCGTGPFLRGFYFCGTRIFLQNLFTGIVLADSIGTRPQVNGKANVARRLLLAAVAAASLLMAAWWTVSYSNNAQLVHDALAAAQELPHVGLTSGRRLASSDALRVLSKVRETLQMVNDYERRGPPLSYRALLYQGTVIRPSLRKTYYAMFRRLLLQSAQQTLIQVARNPGDYQYVYNALKAYLITTVNHDKHWDNLAVVLVEYWKKDLPAGSEREAMAMANFKFYAQELPEANPDAPDSGYDSETVEMARTFLNGFPLEDAIYQAILGSLPDYPNFTKTAYNQFHERLNDEANLHAEDWVLGQSTKRAIDYEKVRNALRSRYEQDYAKAGHAKAIP